MSCGFHAGTNACNTIHQTLSRFFCRRVWLRDYLYRASPRGSTKESAFFHLYGRDPRSAPYRGCAGCTSGSQTDTFDDYKTKLSVSMTEAWNLARANVKQAQEHQKAIHDRRSRPGHFRLGQRVFVYMPGDKQGKA